MNMQKLARQYYEALRPYAYRARTIIKDNSTADSEDYDAAVAYFGTDRVDWWVGD